ncbi:MAG TPA: MOSC N-terminal beta barrel domain-containing protein [Candidatus Acidoferrales bacterium]|nr:MOSC N-terminal beta barrel domain-containing protein [Candidatus Acidoferrales bacterium]
MRIGTLRAIARYPVKSLRGEALEACAVLPEGLEGDRRTALVAPPEHARAGKTYRGKENDRLHLVDTLEEARALAPGLRVEESEERYFDDAPVSLILDRWLDGISNYVGYRVEWQRFRPNFFAQAEDGIAIDEVALTGRELQIGAVTLRVRYPIERCVVPTYDLQGGEADPRILRYVAQARSNWMGIYCDVPRAGIARIGDSLELIER